MVWGSRRKCLEAKIKRVFRHKTEFSQLLVGPTNIHLLQPFTTVNLKCNKITKFPYYRVTKATYSLSQTDTN